MLHNWLRMSDYVVEEYDEMKDDNYDDDDVSVVSSYMSSITDHDDIDLDEHKTRQSPDELDEWKNLTEAGMISSTTDSLKFLGNAKKRKFNPLVLTDGFVQGNNSMMESIKKDRKRPFWK